MPDVARVMNSDAPYGNSISSVYWSVSDNSVLGVLDRTRTALLSLVAEIRAAGVHGLDLPSPQAASPAVNAFLPTDTRRVYHLSSAHDTGAGTATVTAAFDTTHET